MEEEAAEIKDYSKGLGRDSRQEMKSLKQGDYRRKRKGRPFVRNFQVDSMGLTMPGHWGGRKNEESRVMLSSVGAASRPRVFECN